MSSIRHHFLGSFWCILWANRWYFWKDSPTRLIQGYDHFFCSRYMSLSRRMLCICCICTLVYSGCSDELVKNYIDVLSIRRFGEFIVRWSYLAQDPWSGSSRVPNSYRLSVSCDLYKLWSGRIRLHNKLSNKMNQIAKSIR